MAVDESITRTCPACRETKPLSAFYCRKGKFYGPCRPCASAQAAAWAKANPERKRAKDREYYQQNREELIRKGVEYARRNPELTRVRNRRYRERNIERVRANEAAYRERKRQECNQRINAWKAKNKHLLAFYSRGRHDAARRATPKWANAEAMRAIYAEASRLRRETGVIWHVDHIVPLISELVCGLHWEGNLQVIRGEDNLKKNNSQWPDMPYPKPIRKLANV